MANDISLRSWGVVYNSNISYSRGYECLYCGWELYKSAKNGNKALVINIIGFSTDSPFRTTKENVVGVVIIECPECFEKFCFHATADLVKLAKQHCERWPKS